MVSVIVHNSKNRVRIPLKSTVFSVKLFNGPGWLIKQKITFLNPEIESEKGHKHNVPVLQLTVTSSNVVDTR